MCLQIKFWGNFQSKTQLSMGVTLTFNIFDMCNLLQDIKVF